jgi:hypothetical protein
MNANKTRVGGKFLAIERGMLPRWRGWPFQGVLRQLAAACRPTPVAFRNSQTCRDPRTT